MYDYVVRDTENDRDIELKDTGRVYDHRIDGEVSPHLTKARDIFVGRDMVLLCEDIAKWSHEGITDGFIGLKESYCLGPSTRAVTCVPPQTLLNKIAIV